MSYPIKLQALQATTLSAADDQCTLDQGLSAWGSNRGVGGGGLARCSVRCLRRGLIPISRVPGIKGLTSARPGFLCDLPRVHTLPVAVSEGPTSVSAIQPRAPVLKNDT